jgi:hypothetical protein
MNAPGSCKDSRFKHIVKFTADEILARLNGGQVDNLPTRRSPSLGNILTLLAMIGSVLLVGWAAASANSENTVRIRNAEVRIEEFRADVAQLRRDTKEILIAVTEMRGREDERNRNRGK